MMRYDGVIAHESIIQIILTQVCKSVMFGMFELIHIFFTRGTGLAIVRSPLHLLVEIILVFDVLYYLNWDDSMRVSSSKTGGLLRRIL